MESTMSNRQFNNIYLFIVVHWFGCLCSLLFMDIHSFGFVGLVGKRIGYFSNILHKQTIIQTQTYSTEKLLNLKTSSDLGHSADLQTMRDFIVSKSAAVHTSIWMWAYLETKQKRKKGKNFCWWFKQFHSLKIVSILNNIAKKKQKTEFR